MSSTPSHFRLHSVVRRGIFRWWEPWMATMPWSWYCPLRVSLWAFHCYSTSGPGIGTDSSDFRDVVGWCINSYTITSTSSTYVYIYISMYIISTFIIFIQYLHLLFCFLRSSDAISTVRSPPARFRPPKVFLTRERKRAQVRLEHIMVGKILYGMGYRYIYVWYIHIYIHIWCI